MTYTLAIGSVSHGTMRSEDLLDSFSWELEQILKSADITEDMSSVISLLGEINVALAANRWGDADMDKIEETMSELVNACFDVLGEYIPPYCYFGAHEGDGSDYGVWPAIDDFDGPKVDDPSELDDLGPDESEALFVNDHGNVTLYARGADGEWSSVWSIV